MDMQFNLKTKTLAIAFFFCCLSLQLNATTSIIPLSNLLDEHGGLQNQYQLTGSVDFSGYIPIIDECDGLLFLPMPLAPGWNALGSGMSGPVSAIAVSGSDVYVGGYFTNAGGNANADRIARWDGSTWNALGTGLNNSISTIAVSGSDVYVGGSFTNAGGNPDADFIARWDGSAWNVLGIGLYWSVNAIAVSGRDVYVGGDFVNAGGNPNADFIARWDGSTWNALGTGLNGSVWGIAISGNDVYVGGNFTDAGGNVNADRVARWNGGTWNALGTGLNSMVGAIAVSGTDVYVSGSFTDAGGDSNADNLARWDGSTWSALGTGLRDVTTIGILGGEVYVGGHFKNLGGNDNADYIARWDGSTWNAVGSGINSPVITIAVIGSDVYVCGGFVNAGGNADADYIARWGETTVLPVELLTFDAVQHEASIWIDWRTAIQVNNEGWDVEHSIDGRSWEKIAWIQGNGNSSIPKQYHAVHQNPKHGFNYYRIRQIDFDGKYEYSKVVSVDFKNTEEVKIYPTLTTGSITIESNPEDIEKIRVFDALGGFQFEVKRTNNISLSDKPSGLYILQILKAGKWTSKRAVKR